MKQLLTYSMISSFMSCRKRYDYRYRQEIIPAQPVTALTFGSAVHLALQHYFEDLNEKKRMFSQFYGEVAASYVGLDTEDSIKAKVLMEKYVQHYETSDHERFYVEAVEKEFSLPLISPAGRKSGLFVIAGKVDGLIRNKADGKLYILEHKTTSICDDGYISRILIDTQIGIYAEALSRIMGEEIVGAVYDILIKPAIRMKSGETDEEFEARKAELLAKSKTGKTSAKKREAETEEEFVTRLRESVNSGNFRREIVVFDKVKQDALKAEIWAVAHDIRSCRCFYKNTGNCNRYGICPYMDLCRANGNMTGLDELYKRQNAHSELSEDLTSSFKQIF